VQASRFCRVLCVAPTLTADVTHAEIVREAGSNGCCFKGFSAPKPTRSHRRQPWTRWLIVASRLPRPLARDMRYNAVPVQPEALAGTVPTGAMVMDPTATQTAQDLRDILAQFEQQNPAVAEALQIMNISFSEYLQALAAMRESGSASGNALIPG
jgi:hypothetical protein